ncbi:MAG: hypothetical protein DRJ09_02665 [Bacteroidetes bacterium]|nr:MAG: hypothetical protein DRJ09_02665 [Bacteroidota bacterium]
MALKFTKQFHQNLEHNISLLVLNFIYVFVWGLTDGKMEKYGFGIIFSLIFVFAIRAIKEHNSKLYYFSAVAIIIFWISFFFDMKYLMLTSHLFSVVFFIIVVVLSIIKLAKAKVISAIEFIEAVNIYFYLGIIGSILLSVTYWLNPDAFSAGNPLTAPADFIYFSFVTLTSLGYGDISPVDPMARSISIFLSFSGQIYIAMIISMLVGKYLNAKQND